MTAEAFFALVHGGAHGGWCWERLVPELEQLGHGCCAPDLPFEEPNGAAQWADAVVSAIPADAQQVMVVGHSLAGLCLPVIAQRRRVNRLVFLGAMVPVPRRPYLDVLAEEPDAITVPEASERIIEGAPDNSEGDAVMSFERARAVFYGDLDEDTARRAWRRLRPMGTTAFSEPCPIDRWPDVPSTYVLMTDDAAVNPAWSRRVAIGRLGADLIELPGSHSPFYSRPRELAGLLHDLSQR